MLLIKYNYINMRRLKLFFNKLFNRQKTEKEKRLSELRKDDIININIPNGYSKTINGSQYSDQPISISIFNNDPISRKVWFYCTVNGHSISFVKSYDSAIFENFLLFNFQTDEIITVVESKKTKEELKKELEEAISKENFEMANLINNKLKDIN